MNPLKILHVGNHTIPCVGGIETVIWELATFQAEKGHAVSILVFDTCGGDNVLPDFEERANVKIYRTPRYGLSFYGFPSLRVLAKLASKFDIIHVHGFGGWVDMLLLTKWWHHSRIIVTSHGGFFHTPKRLIWKWLYHSWLRVVGRFIDGVTFVAKSDYNRLSFFSKEKVHIIPNGLDLRKYLTLPLSKKKMTNLLFVGRLSQNKRVDRLIETMRFVVEKKPDVKLYIVGSDWDGLLSSYSKKVEFYGLTDNIFFLGAVSDKELLELYSQCGLFVSASEYEGFGISALEGMGAGCIPILNDIPTFRNFTENARGLCVDFSKPKTACIPIIKWAQKPVGSKLKSLIKNNRNYLGQFSWNTVVDAYDVAYHTAR